MCNFVRAFFPKNSFLIIVRCKFIFFFIFFPMPIHIFLFNRKIWKEDHSFCCRLNWLQIGSFPAFPPVGTVKPVVQTRHREKKRVRERIGVTRTLTNKTTKTGWGLFHEFTCTFFYNATEILFTDNLLLFRVRMFRKSSGLFGLMREKRDCDYPLSILNTMSNLHCSVSMLNGFKSDPWPWCWFRGWLLWGRRCRWSRCWRPSPANRGVASSRLLDYVDTSICRYIDKSLHR